MGQPTLELAQLARLRLSWMQVRVKAVDLAELRTAVDAVRTLAGLGGGAYTDAAVAGTLIKAAHITQLRSAIDEARGPLGLSTGGFTDSPLDGLPIKAVHFAELQGRVQ